MFSIDNLDLLCYRYDQRDYEREVFMKVHPQRIKDLKEVLQTIINCELMIYKFNEPLNSSTEFTPTITELTKLIEILEGDSL